MAREVLEYYLFFVLSASEHICFCVGVLFVSYMVVQVVFHRPSILPFLLSMSLNTSVYFVSYMVVHAVFHTLDAVVTRKSVETDATSVFHV